MPAQPQKPFVSVIVPVYNGRNVIVPCVQSLLAQDYPRDRYEVIVADNGSTDDTAKVLEPLRVRVISSVRVRTPYAARNDGVRLSMGEMVAFCDSDELAAPNWLSALVSAMKDGYGGAAGPMLGQPQGAGAVADFAAREATFKPSDREEDITLAPTGNVLYRREVFEKLGGFREDTVTGADYDFSLRVGKLGLKIRYVPEAVIWHHHRGTLRKLLRHEARIAFGREWVSVQHGHKRRSTVALIAGLAMRSAKSCAAAFLSILRAPHRRQAWTRSGFILIGPMMGCANVYGKLRFRLKAGIPRDW